jgi:hypothetical protein
MLSWLVAEIQISSTVLIQKRSLSYLYPPVPPISLLAHGQGNVLTLVAIKE